MVAAAARHRVQRRPCDLCGRPLDFARALHPQPEGGPRRKWAAPFVLDVRSSNSVPPRQAPVRLLEFTTSQPADGNNLASGLDGRADHGQSRAQTSGHGRAGGARGRSGLPRCGHFGYHGRDKRQGFDACTKTPLGAEFDVFMAWSVDRLGRSLQDLTAFMQELRSPKINLFLRQQGLDTHDACRQNDVSGAWLISSMRGT